MDERPYQLNQVAIRMVQEPPLLSKKPMNNPEAAIGVMRDVFKDYDREVICVVNLKSNLQPISLNIASIGAIDHAVAHPRELLKSAVLSNAASVILMHLHPSGDLEPSDLDIAMTDKMQQAFSLIGIGVVDHIIMADRDEYFSFREREVMPAGEPQYTTEGITIIAPVQVKEKKEPPDTRSRQQSGQPPQSGQTKAEPDEKLHLYFKAVTVFDISSTDGEPLPTLDVKELTGSAKGYDAFMQALTAISPVPVRFDEVEGGAKGYYHHVNKEIVIQKDMSQRQTMKTAAHELSHALLHDRDHMKQEGIQKSRQLIEQEAESVAFCVCSYFGLDEENGEGSSVGDYSFPYIAGWAQSADMTELRSSMETIRKTAGMIIDGIETEMTKQMGLQQKVSPEQPPEQIQDTGEKEGARLSVLEALKKEKQTVGKNASGREKTVRIADRPKSRQTGKEMML